MQPQSQDNNPYGFITESQHPGRKPLLGNGSKMSKILFAIGLATIVTVIAVLAATIFGGSGGGAKENYTKLLQQQAEIIRIAELGGKDAQNSATKNFAITTSQTLQSTKTDLTSLAKSSGADIEPKTILLGKDSTVDKTLTTAGQINNYDAVFKEVLTKKLNEYGKTLQDILEATKQEKSRTILKSAIDSIKLLIK